MDQFPTLSDKRYPPRPSRRFPAVLSTAVIVGVAVGGITYAYQKEQADLDHQVLTKEITDLQSQLRLAKSLPSTPAPTVSPTPQVAALTETATPTPSPVVLGGAGTYTNTQYGFSLNYPAGLTKEDTAAYTLFQAEGGDQFSISIKDQPFTKDGIGGLYGKVDPSVLTQVQMGSGIGYRYASEDGSCGGNVYVTGTRDATKSIEVTFTSCEGERKVISPDEQSIISSFRLEK